MPAKLHEQQRVFTVSLFDPDREIPAFVFSHTARHPVRRFNIYRNNVTSSLIDLLQAYFPVVTRLVGDEFFRAMAKVFVVERPPRSPILSRYGSDFATFIEGFEPVADVPYLADVARLEWLVQRAYHAADRRALSPADLIGVPPDLAGNVIFELHPSLGIISSSYPIASIWKTNTLDEQVQSIDIADNGEDALVIRPDSEVLVMSLPAGALSFVTALAAGLAIGAAHDQAIADTPSFSLQHAVAALLEAGVIVGWHLGEQPGNPSRGAQ